ncbi:MAG: CoxG family protein [Candidatus Velthaea sp.]
MNLQFNGVEVVAAPKAIVWEFINDPNKIATCIPDVLVSTVHDAHSFDPTVQVAVGPVRGKFKFKVQLLPQPGENHMDMKISGGGLGSVVDLIAGADIQDNGDGTTTLDWKATASMRGPVATIGGRVIDAQAQRVIGTTFANVKTKLAGATAGS